LIGRRRAAKGWAVIHNGQAVDDNALCHRLIAERFNGRATIVHAIARDINHAPRCLKRAGGQFAPRMNDGA
jgi:hypothetical protein